MSDSNHDKDEVVSEDFRRRAHPEAPPADRDIDVEIETDEDFTRRVRITQILKLRLRS